MRNEPRKHSHVFDTGNPAAERGTLLVMAITAAAMVVEIWAGWWFNSMALLADGWHMSSHAAAIGVSAVAYLVARRQAGNPRFAFGTWKIEVLGGFASALFLLGVAAMMIAGSVQRLLAPQPIQFREAILVAFLGLVVNIICAFILGDAHDHDHHDHGGHEHDHHDLNLRSAYLHVMADAATSVLAIVALAGGLWFGWQWLDPVMGVVGAILVGLWARGLLRDTSRVLLDGEMDHPMIDDIRAAIGRLDPGARITDLHVWRVGRSRYACILVLGTSRQDLTPQAVKACLDQFPSLIHVTVEVELVP
jgi:cation diffusion facilitator family transporter